MTKHYLIYLLSAQTAYIYIPITFGSMEGFSVITLHKPKAIWIKLGKCQ